MTKLYISPKKVVIILSIIVLSLIAAHVLGQYYKFFIGSDPLILKAVDKLNLDGESNNIPNWYQSSSLLLSSFILLIIGLLKRAEKDLDFRYWAFLAFTFLYLSLDELISIHEQATLPLRHAFKLSGYFYLSWVIPAGVVVLVFGLTFLKFLLRLDSKTRFLFIMAASIYLFGAVGVEMLDGKYLNAHESQINGPGISEAIAFNYSLMTAAEEFFEMSGIIIFVYALLSLLMPAAEPRTVSAKQTILSGTKAVARQTAIVNMQIK